MDHPNDTLALERRLARISRVAAVVSTLFGISGLVGWWLDSPALRTLVPDWPPLSPASALCLALGGVALVIWQRGTSGRRVSRLLGTVVLVIPTWSLVAAISNSLPGPDWVLLASIHSPIASGMTPAASGAFVLVGLGVLALFIRPRAWLNLSMVLGAAAMAVASLGLLEKIALPQADSSDLTGSTALALVPIGLALTMARVASGFSRTLARDNPVAFLGRRLLLAILVLPPTLFLAQLLWIGPGDPALHKQLTVNTLVYAGVLVVVLVVSLRELDHADSEKRQFETERDLLLANLQRQAATLQDEVSRRTAELRQANEGLQFVLSSAGYGVWTCDPETRGVTLDNRAKAVFGLQAEGLNSALAAIIAHAVPGDRNRVEESLDRFLTGSLGSYEAEFRIRRPDDGQIRQIDARGYRQAPAAGSPGRVVGLVRDVTDARERERQVGSLTERLRFVIGAAGFGVWEYDFATKRLESDDTTLAIFALRREEATGTTSDWSSRVHPDDLPGVRARFDDAVAGRIAAYDPEYRIVLPDGSIRHIESRSYVIRDPEGRPLRMVGLNRDITDSCEMREHLRITEERWRLALASNNDGVWDRDLASGTTYRDERFAEIIGLTPAELDPVSTVWEERAHPDDLQRIRTAQALHWQGETELYRCEYRLRHKRGDWVWVLDRGKIVARDGKGRPLRMVGTQTDITSRKMLEERVRHNEELALQLSRLAQIGAWEIELASRTLTWAPEIYRIHEVELGYTPNLDSMLGFYPAEAREQLAHALSAAMQTGSPFDLELPFTTARGNSLWVRILGRSDADHGSPTRVYGSFQDITARRDAEEMRRQLESQLFHAQKMETLGTLAGGIAHDFNNLLTGILGYQDLALDDLPQAHQARSFIAAARDASLRARELVDQILTFSRQAGAEKVPVNLKHVIEDARRFLRATVPASIRIDVSVAADCPPVLADAAQIHQVLLNLGSNAAHAMRATGGEMRMTLSRTALEAGEIPGARQLPAGSYVRLDFTDTGHGMNRETQERIFDPFFTTKEVGQGTGLGLSVVHGIVESHQGAITVDSRPGHGTTFAVYLPAAETSEPSEQPASANAPRGSGERVAVVDDEDMVRQFAEMSLAKLGYAVASFSQPGECLEAIRRDPAGFTLLLTDQTMPGMKGIELAAEVRSVAPALPVVIMSGYFSRISPDMLARLGHVALLSKPFTNDELARTIHQSLHPESAAPVV